MNRLEQITNRLTTVRDWMEIHEETEAGINGVIDDLNELITSKPEVRLVEAQFESMYKMFTTINDVTFESGCIYNIQEVKQFGFKITHIKDR